MLHLLLIIISYGALLLLLMPATGVGIVSTAVAFAIGVCVIIFSKVYKIAFWKNRSYLLISAALLIAATFGVNFYDRWIPSSKMQGIAAMVHMPVEMLLLFGSLMLSGLSAYVLYAVLQPIANRFSDTDPRKDFAKHIVLCLAASAVTVVLAQVMIGTEVFSMGCANFMWGVLAVAAAILFVYCLLGRVIPAIFLGAGFFMVISTVNVYVYSFRGRLFEPVDVFSAGTAMNVAGNYSLLPVPPGALTGWGIFAAMLIVLYCLQRKSTVKLVLPRRCALLASCIIGAAAVFSYAAKLNTYHWQDQGAEFNGYILDFFSKVKEISVPEPDHYSMELIDELTDRYAADGNSGAANGSSKPPHIIVIMDEAFSDLSVVGEFATNTEVMPFISSLKEDTVSGYALASVYGGNTANSEYEFLTGNSMAWLSPNAVPYQQYVRASTYSMVSYLKSSYDYTCVAMHPYESSGWNRPVAYEHLGFDACYFIEDFPQQDFVRGFVSDQEMFAFLIEKYEAQKEDPLFFFGVTMQNHGDYDYSGENYTQHISLDDYAGKYPDVEQYLSLIHETDRAVEYLITYFQNTDEDVVIVFFGDHQPKINESFYGAVRGTTGNTLDRQQKRYEVPFFIWTNYDIEEKHIESTSLNYLSTYVYDTAGIALPPYNHFLREMEERIPSINANGFYSLSAGRYVSFDKANEDERSWLESYEALQYNSIFDTKQRSQVFFPVLD